MLLHPVTVMPSTLPVGSPRPPGPPWLPTAEQALGGGGRRRCWPRQRQKGCAAHFRRNCAAERGGESRWDEPSSS